LADIDIKNKLEAAKGEMVRLKNMKNYHGKNQEGPNLTMIPKQYQWIENRSNFVVLLGISVIGTIFLIAMSVTTIYL
jgi:hypothetical protein